MSKEKPEREGHSVQDEQETTATVVQEEAPPPEAEVAEKPRRRSFTAEYKLAILEETDGAEPGEVGRVLRREGLYSSHLTEWRRARRKGALGSLSRRRGRKAKAPDPSAKQVARLERENAHLREKLRKAELIIEAQGKVAGLLGFSLEDGKGS